MSSSFISTVVKHVKSFMSLQKVTSTTSLKRKSSLPLIPTSTTKNTKPCSKQLTRSIAKLLDYLEQAEKEAEEGVPVLEQKIKAAEVIEISEDVETTSAVQQGQAYYEGLLEDYFENDSPAIFKELGMWVPQSQSAVAI